MKARMALAIFAIIFGLVFLEAGDETPTGQKLQKAKELLKAADTSDDEAHWLNCAKRAADLLSSFAGPPEEKEEAKRIRALAQDFLAAVSLFNDTHTGERGYKVERKIRQLLEKFKPHDPLYTQASFYLARLIYWRWRESGGKEYYQRSRELFQIFHKKFPQNELCRMYLGEKIPSGVEYKEGTEGAPQWAVKEREALCRILDIIHYWVKERQEADGQLGGGWADDCEILRFWAVAIAAADDPTCKKGMKKLVDGIWESGLIEHGFAKRLSDVEHSAEPTSDTQPLMVGLDYGNPVYIERCMETMKCFRDVWTAVNERGHRHFRSAWISATQVDPTPPRAVDVPYHARAAKPGVWLGWYNKNPTVVKLFSEWSRAWVEDSLKTEKGKPEGVLPAAIRFSDCAIGGYSDNWYDPGLPQSYFVWPGATGIMYEQLLATYALTGDEFFLGPIILSARLREKYQGKKVADENLRRALKGLRLGGPLGKMRILSGKREFDELISRRGGSYMGFLLTGDKKGLIRGLEKSIDSTKYNLPLLTTEVRWTDRVYVRGAELLFSMYTGGAGNPNYYPSYAITWEDTGADFAALVLRASLRHLKVLAYNFAPKEREVGIRLWRIGKGSCILKMGPDADGDSRMDFTTKEMQFLVTERGERLRIRLPSKELMLIEITNQEEVPQPPQASGPDLALTAEDISTHRLEDGRLNITAHIHNIGSAPIKEAEVVFYADGQEIGREKIANLPAPIDLEPKVEKVSIILPSGRAPQEVTVEARLAKEEQEITLTNNKATLKVP